MPSRDGSDNRGMRRQGRCRSLSVRVACAWLILCAATGTALADQRLLRTRIANYDHALVVLEQASTQLVEVYGDPNQVALAIIANGQMNRPALKRVRYLNRMNQEVATYQLEGELSLRNTTPKTVTALEITTIFFNAFRERISTERQTLIGSIEPRRTQRVQWSRPLPQKDTYELYVVVTKIRFDDGTIWAPVQELILLP